jgi:hypothetical protein
MMIQNDTKIKNPQTWRLLGNPRDRFKVFFQHAMVDFHDMKRRRCGHPAGGKVTLLGRFEVIIVELERKHA